MIKSAIHHVLASRFRLPLWLLLGLVMLVSGCSQAAAPKGLASDLWDEVLTQHAHDGGFDYAAAKGDAASLRKLDAFLGEVRTMPDSAPLSQWLNAYNALVVKSVLDRFPLDSVRSVDGFFDKIEHRVAGRAMTLDTLENEIIRERFPDARVHAALNCGAASCPPLHGRAFREENLNGSLDRLSRAFVASPDHVRIQDGALEVSELFFWFSSDFERDAGSARAWIERFDAGNRLAAVPAEAELGRIPYGWALNNAPGAGTGE